MRLVIWLRVEGEDEARLRRRVIKLLVPGGREELAGGGVLGPAAAYGHGRARRRSDRVIGSGPLSDRGRAR